MIAGKQKKSRERIDKSITEDRMKEDQSRD